MGNTASQAFGHGWDVTGRRVIKNNDLWRGFDTFGAPRIRKIDEESQFLRWLKRLSSLQYSKRQ